MGRCASIAAAHAATDEPLTNFGCRRKPDSGTLDTTPAGVEVAGDWSDTKSCWSDSAFQRSSHAQRPTLLQRPDQPPSQSSALRCERLHRLPTSKGWPQEPRSVGDQDNGATRGAAL